MAENSILLELNITAKDTKKSIEGVTAALKKLRSESERAISKMRGVTQSFRIANSAAGELSTALDGVSGKFMKIAVNAGSAARSIKSFARAAKSVNPNLKNGNQTNALANVNNQMASARASFSGYNYNRSNALVPVMPSFYERSEYSEAGSPFSFEYDDSVMDYDDKTQEIASVKNEMSSLAKIAGTVKTQLAGAAKGFVKFTAAAIQSRRAAEKTTGVFGKLGAAIARIAFYRAIRSMIKGISQAFREGVNNLVLYSKALNGIDSAHANQTMSEFATTALYVKNSLGAMVMPLLQALVPVVNAVANAFVAAANAVNMFFHALKGEGMFTKAKRYAVDYAEGLDKASGSAKEMKKQIFGFDELNIFNKPSSGGGGGGDAMDYSKMFEESPVASWVQKLANDQNWESLGAIFAMKLNGIVKKFDAEAFGTDLGLKLQSVIGTVYGFLETFDFKEVGGKIAVALNNALGAIKPEELGHIFATKWTAALDILIGFISKFDTKKLTNAISKFIIGGFDHLSEWLGSVKWGEFGATLYEKIKGAVEGIDFAGIANSLFTFLGNAIRAAWELAKGFVTNLATDISNYFKGKAEECGGSTILGFFKGILDIFASVTDWVIDHIFLPFWNALTGGSGFNISGGVAQAMKSIGASVAKGILNPIAAPFLSIAKWVSENIVNPFVSAAKEKFGITDGESGEFKGIGKAIIDGFFAGLKGAWKSVAEWISQKASAVKQTFKNIIEGAKSVTPQSPRYIDYGVAAGLFAEGGQPQTGSLFWAGERGAELVGSVGGKTTVTTHDQFSEGMSEIMDNTNTVILQAAQGIVQAILSKDMTVINNISDRAIVNAYDRGKRLGGTGLAVGSGIV